MSKPDRASLTQHIAWQRMRRPLRWAGWTLAVLLVLAALSWAALPALVRKIAVDQTQAQTGRKLEIGEIAFNPFKLALRAADITLYEADGTRPFFSAKGLLADLSAASLVRLAPVLDEIKLSTPQLHVVRVDAEGSGHYNFSDILERLAAQPKSEGQARFSLANVQLQDGQIRFEDKVSGKNIDIAALQVGLPFISNLPGNIDSFVQPQLSATINGTPLHLKGRSKPFASTQESAFAIDIDQLDLVGYLPFIPAELPVLVQGAKLSTKLDLGFTRKDDKPTVTLAGDVRLDDLALQDKARAPLLKAKSVALQVKQFDVLAASGELTQLTLEQPQVWASMNARGEINWQRALAGGSSAANQTSARNAKKEAAAPAASAPQPASSIVLQQLTVRGGEVNWRDEANATPAQAIKLSKIDINASQLSTAADAKPAHLTLSVLENRHGRLAFDGQLQPLKAGVAGKITLENIDLAGYQNYLSRAPISGVAGKLSGQTTLQLRDGHLKLDDSKVQLADLRLTPPGKGAQPLALESLSLQAPTLTDTLDQAIAFKLQARFDKNGSADLAGQAAAHFRSVVLDLDVKDLPITPFQHYFTDVLNVTISSGLASAKGKLELTPPLDDRKLALDYKGNAAITNLRMQDKQTATDFLRWRTLDLAGIQAKLGGRPQVALEKVTLSNFYARAILSDKGRLNLQDIVVSDAQEQGSITDDGKKDSKPASTGSSRKTVSAAPVTPPAAPADAPIVRVGQVVLEGGNINYTDNFVKPNYTANMTGLSGSIGQISSEKPQPAPVNISGKIDNDAPLQISGSLNPLFKPMYLDLKASANGVQLPRLTPYSAKYAGYPITKGKLSMDVQYKIENDKLVAQNDLRIEQLSFGERVDSPDATNLPVMLAVSLLKDRDGNINLNLPISGSLSDPEFSVGGIIVRVFVNLIVKAVTSPFALIGSMFRPDEHIGELRYIEFSPGSSEVTDEVRKKLDALGYALHERPGIKLDITGRVDPQVDDQGLRREALERAMRSLKRADLIAKEGQPAGPVRVSAAERGKYLERVYKDAKFDKPRNMIGLTKSMPEAEMEKMILEHTEVTKDDLRNLAQRRADQVRNYLQEQSVIDPARIFLIAPKLDGAGIPEKEPKARVELTIQ
jgi:outer membrane protein OmpA-like peptidoglycan-associated protein